jgi:hypothetical protein
VRPIQAHVERQALREVRGLHETAPSPSSMKNSCTQAEQITVGDLGRFVRCGVWNGKKKVQPRKRSDKERKMEKSTLKQAELDETATLGDFYDDGMGDPGEWSPVWGAVLGAGLTEGGILIAKAMRKSSPNVAKYAGAVGLLAGGVPSAIAIIFPSTRRAGFLGLAVSAIAGVGELIRSHYVEPTLGLYQPEMTGADTIEVMGGPDHEADMMAEALIAGALGQTAPGGGQALQIVGQATPQQALAGLGLYQPEMTGARPLEVSGVNPYSGQF